MLRPELSKEEYSVEMEKMLTKVLFKQWNENDGEVERALVSIDWYYLKHIAVTINGDPNWNLMFSYEREGNLTAVTGREVADLIKT